MHFQSPPFWWLMTNRLKLTNKTLKRNRFLGIARAPLNLCFELNFKMLASNANSTNLEEKACELPLYLRISGVQHVLATKIKTVMHMAWQELHKEKCRLFGQGRSDRGCRPVRPPSPFSPQKHSSNNPCITNYHICHLRYINKFYTLNSTHTNTQVHKIR
jgi:hypothetical protein